MALDRTAVTTLVCVIPTGAHVIAVEGAAVCALTEGYIQRVLKEGGGTGAAVT